MNFWRADEEVKPIAEKVIAAHRRDLFNVNFVFIFKEKASKKGGKIVIAKVRKVRAKEKIAYDSDVDFVIEIGHNAWEELNDKQKEAVIFHELCHCLVDENEEGEKELSILPHEIEEFADVIEVYGLYTFDIQKFVEKALKSDTGSKKEINKEIEGN